MSLFVARKGGFTLIEVLLVITIIGFLAAIAGPNFVKSRTVSRRNVCIANLAQIESTKQIWAMQNGKKTGDTPTDADLFGVTAYLKKKPECPAGGDYDLKPVDTNPTCTIEGHKL